MNTDIADDELDEDNNLAVMNLTVLEPLPTDLIVASINVPTDSLPLNNPTDIIIDVMNDSGAPANVSIVDTYLSTDQYHNNYPN